MLQFPLPDDRILPGDIKIVWPPTEAHDTATLNRITGSLVGLAIGDALGASVEFRPQQYLAAHPVREMMAGGTWGLRAGQWTDDTSMALCLASSLITQRGFNPYDQLVRYKWWYKSGYLSSTGQCFDIGNATRNSLEEFYRRQNLLKRELNLWTDYEVDRLQLNFLERIQFNVNCSHEGVAGNGALMRLAPVPLFFYRTPPVAVEFSGQSARLTHGDKVAVDACRYYGALIVAAVRGESKESILSDQFYYTHYDWFGSQPLHDEIAYIAQGSFKKSRGYKDGIRGKGHIVCALEAALWAFWSANSFEKGALNAVNLGDDTDTTAAIYGQLAGAYYGYNKIPEKWVNQLYANELIICIAEWLQFLGSSQSKAHGQQSAVRRGPQFSTPLQQPHYTNRTRSRQLTSAVIEKPQQYSRDKRSKSAQRRGRSFADLLGCTFQPRYTDV
jgi:ADP-ribosylglycohydrolase